MCKSINFRLESLHCELNDADKSTHPWDYGPSKRHVYSDYPYQTLQVRIAINQVKINKTKSTTSSSNYQVSLIITQVENKIAYHLIN